MIKDTNQIVTTKQKEDTKKDFIFAVGRRKEAVARVRLYPNLNTPLAWGDQTINKGEIFVNKKLIGEYFNSLLAKNKAYQQLFEGGFNQFTLTIKVKGGGLSGQLGAVIQGVARAISKHNPKSRTAFKKKGFLTRDSRTRERRKVGRGGKARRVKQSPKR